MKKKYTQEQIQQALDLYQNTDLLLEEIAKKTGVEKHSISHYAAKAGLPLRHRRSKIKVCRFCHKTISLPNIKFCPYCGKDIRSEQEIIFLEAEKLFSFAPQIAEEDKDEYKHVVNEIVTYLKKGI